MDYLDRVPQGDPEDSRDLFLEWTAAVSRVDNEPESAFEYYKRIEVFASTFTVAPSTSVMRID